MRSWLVILFLATLGLLSCDGSKTDGQDRVATIQRNPARRDTTRKVDWLTATLAEIPANLTPVAGYRFSIVGDFDGDGRKERLTEHFLSGLSGHETNKFYDSLGDYDQLVALTIAKNPISVVTCNNSRIDTLRIDRGGQLLGLSLLRNEGDLNGDGREEVSYVINHADWSNLNSCHIVTLTKDGWMDLYSFMVNELNLPPLPDFASESERKEFRQFKGFITKLRHGYIRVERDDPNDTAALIMKCPQIAAR